MAHYVKFTFEVIVSFQTLGIHAIENISMLKTYERINDFLIIIIASI